MKPCLPHIIAVLIPLVLLLAAYTAPTVPDAHAQSPERSDGLVLVPPLKPNPRHPLRTLPVSPGLFGFGTDTVAGSGRHQAPTQSAIMIVSNLADQGPGSLRACVEASTPRTCVFEVAGVIPITRIIRARSPYLTIAGQTAPEPGITITQGGLRIETHDVLVQHIAIRPGDSEAGVAPVERDGVSIGGSPPTEVFNVVLDHLSITWAIDENLSTYGATTHDITISNSIIAEGLHDSIHPKGPHSKGVMIGNGSTHVTLVNNVISSHEERNPYLKPGTSTEVLNNVVYGWGSRGGWSLCNVSNNDDSPLPVHVSFIRNIYIPGPWSVRHPPLYAKQLAPSSRIFVRDNQTGAPPESPRSPWEITSLPSVPYQTLTPPLESNASHNLTRNDIMAHVLRYSGSRPRQRSAIDQRILDDIMTGQGGLKDCLTGCARSVGRLPEARSRRRHLDLPLDPFKDTDGDGYTNLENWLHRMESEIIPEKL